MTGSNRAASPRHRGRKTRSARTLGPAAALAAVSATMIAAAAAQDALSTDRPGFSFDPRSLERGGLQLEGGFEWADAGGPLSVPLAQLRYGVGERTEVRASWSGVAIDGSTETLGGTVGIKHTFGQGDRGATAVLGTVSIPASGGELTPLLGFLWSRTLTDNVGLFGTVTAEASSEAGNWTWQGTNAVGVAVSLTQKTGVFVEHYIAVVEGGSDDTQYIDGGITYLVNPDVQLDLTGGFSVGSAEADAFVGGGVAYRF